MWIDKDPVTKKCSMNGARYLKEVKKLVDLITLEEIDQNKYWWQQGMYLILITLNISTKMFLSISSLLYYRVVGYNIPHNMSNSVTTSIDTLI